MLLKSKKLLRQKSLQLFDPSFLRQSERKVYLDKLILIRHRERPSAEKERKTKDFKFVIYKT